MQHNVLAEPTQTPSTAHDESDRFDAVIVGAGIAGLTAAAVATRAGKKVLVIEAREEKAATARPQLIHLDKDTRRFLISLSEDAGDSLSEEDTLFLRRIDTEEAEHFAIKDVQDYLKRRIKLGLCLFNYESQVSAIDMQHGNVTISNVNDTSQQHSAKFKNLILADGAQHPTANLLNQYVKYNPTQSRPEKSHVAAYLTVTRKNGQPMCQTPPWIGAILVDGKHCGLMYNEKYSLIKSKGKKLKISIVMHVPTELWNKYSSDPSSGTKYLEHCVASVFDKENFMVAKTVSKKNNVAKDNVKFTTFKMKHMEASKSAFIENGYTVLLAGDARRTADFYLGHGGNDAVMSGRYAAEVINQEMSVLEYESICAKMSEKVSEGTRLMQPMIKWVSQQKDLLVFKVLPQEEEFKLHLREEAGNTKMSDHPVQTVSIHLPKPTPDSKAVIEKKNTHTTKSKPDIDADPQSLYEVGLTTFNSQPNKKSNSKKTDNNNKNDPTSCCNMM